MPKFFVSTQIGKVEIVVIDRRVTSIRFCESKDMPSIFNLRPSTPIQKKVIRQMKEYFDGKRKVFHLDLEPKGTTFEKRVWQELKKLPFGEVTSYKDIAKKVGKEDAVRAVARAIANNPISIAVPCHRVIASDGKLSGYAWGPERKEWLILHERNTGRRVKKRTKQ